MSGQPGPSKQVGSAGPQYPWSCLSLPCSLSVGGAGGAFEQQVAGAVLDLMGDEAQTLTRTQQRLKW